jgi:hypothetical protein
MPETPDVRVDQVWQDADPRLERHGIDRRVRVVEVDDTHATVERFIPPGAEHLHTRPSRRTRIRLDRFRETSTGYRIVEDVPPAEGDAS